MKLLPCVVVRSSYGGHWLSVRAEGGNLKHLLGEMGFEEGEEVVIVSKAEYERLRHLELRVQAVLT